MSTTGVGSEQADSLLKGDPMDGPGIRIGCAELILA